MGSRTTNSHLLIMLVEHELGLLNVSNLQAFWGRSSKMNPTVSQL